MPSAAIHYFSGTGNSYRVARLVGNVLTAKGYRVETFRVGLNRAPPQAAFDLHVFAYPVYATDVPRPMISYINGLPDGKGARAAIITAMGNSDAGPGHQGYDGIALTHAAKILRSRGYAVFFEDVIGYPENVTMIYSPPRVENVHAIRKESDPRVEAMAEMIAAGERRMRQVPAWRVPLCRLFGILYGVFGRRALSLLLVADRACNGCGKCARSCPAGAIDLKYHRPSWDLRCEGCQRCINVCPQQAIQSSLTKALILAAFSIAALVATTALFFLPPFNKSLSGLALVAVLWLAVNLAFPLQILSVILRSLEYVPGVKRFFAIGFTRNYRRYMDPDFNPVEQKAAPSADGK
jgi:ferredoxin/flavodoxin